MKLLRSKSTCLARKVSRATKNGGIIYSPPVRGKNAYANIQLETDS